MCVCVYMYIYICILRTRWTDAYDARTHMHSQRPRVRCSPNVANIREKDKARRLDEIKREGDTEGERKGRDLLLIANYPARQLHIII